MDFQIENKVNKSKFFWKTFLVTNIKFEVILEIFFLKFNNINISFSKKIFIQRTYTINKTLFIIK